MGNNFSHGALTGYIVLALLLLTGGTWLGFALDNPGEVVVDNPAIVAENSLLENANSELKSELDELNARFTEEGGILAEPGIDWKALAWEQVLDEFEDDDKFWSCNGVEYRERDVEFDIEDVGVLEHNNGDVTVTLDVKATCDEDDVRSDREDRTFSVFFDEDDIEDEDWNEAEVEWLRTKVTTA